MSVSEWYSKSKRSSDGGMKSISSSPWSITYCAETQDIFLWKNGERLKLVDDGVSRSAGSVRNVCSTEEVPGALLFTGFNTGDGQSKLWRFRCMLNKLEKEKLLHTKLAPLANINDATRWCDAIQEITDEIVRHSSTVSGIGNADGPVNTVTNESGFSPHDQSSSTSLPIARSSAGTVKKRSESAHSANPKAKKQKLVKCDNKEDNDVMSFASADSAIHTQLEQHLIGTFSLSITNLREPPEYLRIREVKEWYVELLMKILEGNEEGCEDYEELTAPLLVICSVDKQEFKMKSLNTYTYQVVGGVQRFTAITRLMESGRKKISDRRCTIYGAGLSEEAILKVAQHHNFCNQVQRRTMFVEVAATCRRLCFKHFGNGHEDDGLFNPTVPRYNTMQYRKWKKDCINACQTPNVSESYILQAIQMALQPANIYHKMKSVFEKMEEGKLKGQTERTLTLSNATRALSGQFSAKLSHFKPFQGLKNEEKLDLLNKLCEREITMDEAITCTKQLKEERAMQDNFVAEVGLDSWEEALTTLPQFTTRLHLYTGANKHKELAFKEFCSEAKLCKQSSMQEIADENKSTLMIHDVNVTVKVVPPFKMDQLDTFSAYLLMLNVKGLCESEILYIVRNLNAKNSEKLAITMIFGVPFDDITSLCKILNDFASAQHLTIVKVQTDDYLGQLTNAVVTYSTNEIPSLLKECRTNCMCYPEGREEAWLKQLLTWCETESGCNHVYDIFNDNCNFTEVAVKNKVNVTVLQHNVDSRDRFVANLQQPKEDTADTDNSQLETDSNASKEETADTDNSQLESNSKAVKGDTSGNSQLDIGSNPSKSNRSKNKLDCHSTELKSTRSNSKATYQWSKSLSANNPLL